MTQEHSFSFLNNLSPKFDRIFPVFFFRALVIDLVTDSELNQDLQLPTYKGEFLAIAQKLTKKELAQSIEFLTKFKGITKDKLEAMKLLQSHFNLSDCDLAM